MVKANGSDGAVPRPKVGDGLPPFFLGGFWMGKSMGKSENPGENNGKMGKSMGKPWENRKIHGNIHGKTRGMGESPRNGGLDGTMSGIFFNVQMGAFLKSRLKLGLMTWVIWGNVWETTKFSVVQWKIMGKPWGHIWYNSPEMELSNAGTIMEVNGG